MKPLHSYKYYERKWKSDSAIASVIRLLWFCVICLGQRIVNRLRQKVFRSIIRQETAFFDKNPTGELVNRLSTDTTLVGKAITDNVSDGLRSLAQGVAGISLMVNTYFHCGKCNIGFESLWKCEISCKMLLPRFPHVFFQREFPVSHRNSRENIYFITFSSLQHF